MESRMQVVNPLDISEDSATWARRITRLPQPDRLVAIGDLHGDIVKTRMALRLAGVMDDSENWVGGNTVVVQIGDIVDRGIQELKILRLFEKLHKQALQEGGQVILLLGNHEILNMKQQNGRLTTEVFPDYEEWKATQILEGKDSEEDYELEPISPYFGCPPCSFKVRMESLQKGGPLTKRFFGNSPCVLVIGSTVFVHAGLKKEHVEYGLERMNMETRDWVLKKEFEKVLDYHTELKQGITWMRDYSHPSKWKKIPAVFYKALGAIPNAKRMVVGHHIQKDGLIRFNYGSRLAAIDVGMSSACRNSAPEILEIDQHDNVRVLSLDGIVYPESRREAMSNMAFFEAMFKQIAEVTTKADSDNTTEE